MRSRSHERAAQTALFILVIQCQAGGMDEVTKAINHFSVLMEDQNTKLDAVLEDINSLPTGDDFHRLEHCMDTLESNVKVIKAAVTATNHDLKKHTSLPAHVAHGHA